MKNPINGTYYDYYNGEVVTSFTVSNENKDKPVTINRKYKLTFEDVIKADIRFITNRACNKCGRNYKEGASRVCAYEKREDE